MCIRDSVRAVPLLVAHAATQAAHLPFLEEEAHPVLRAAFPVAEVREALVVEVSVLVDATSRR